MLNSRILFVTPPVGSIGSGETGGVETHLLQLEPVLAARGYQIGMVAPEGSIAPAGVEVYQVSGAMSPSATRAERAAVTVAHTGGVLENMWEQALLLQERYDIIAGVSYDWLPFYLTPFFRTPVVHWITIGSAIDEVDRMIEQRWREGRLKLAMYTRAQAETYPFVNAERVHLLYGAVDTDVFRYNSSPQDRLCWAARISPEKGLEDAITAARALDMPLDICGKIQDAAYWQAVTADAGKSITYHGFLSSSELQKRFANARATLVTPHWIEAFGNTVIESLACGTPVVAYDRGGPAEIIEDGKSGVLVPPGDGIAGLVDGVRRALKLDRQAARVRAAQFTIDKMADRFEAFIRSV